MKKTISWTIFILFFSIVTPAIAELTETPITSANIFFSRYIQIYSFEASGIDNSQTIADGGKVGGRLPYAVEWIDGSTAPAYPLTLVMNSGSWTLTWTLTSVDKYQYYSEATGDSANQPTIFGDITITITADGFPTGSLGAGDGTLRLIFRY